MKENPHVSIVVAMSAHNRGIGNNGKLLWHIPDDLRHRFKRLTLHHPVIMGRKTFDSIVGYLGGPFPDRTNIVVTRNKEYQPEGVVVCHSLDDALKEAKKLDQKEIFIGGGAQLYEQALPHVDKLYLTLVDATSEADTFFPDYSAFSKKVFEESHEHNGLHYTWVDLEKPALKQGRRDNT